MQTSHIKSILEKDIPIWIYYPVGMMAVIAKLIFASYQVLYLYLPAPIDDGLMYEAALSITEGNWLGEYNYLTISKHMGFALWEALLHQLGIPILIGNQALIALICMAVVASLTPVISKKWQRLVFFGLLYYIPTATASFTLRPYRDSIFPFVCLLVFACFIAVALRVNNPTWKKIPYLLLGGFALGAAYLLREDGYWVLPFTAVASIITAVCIFQKFGGKKRMYALVRLAIPYTVMVACIMAFSAMNYIHYGRFIVSDFTSSEFSAAIGALARVDADEGETWWSDQKISITAKARSLVYDNVPEFEMLEEWLESDIFFASYGYPQKKSESDDSEVYRDYTSGGFYWAIRRAADLTGVYEDANTAKEYWQNLADEINRLCDEGVLPSSGGKRVSTMPPIRSSYVQPVIEEALHSFWFVITFEDTSCYEAEALSYGYADDITPMEDFFFTPSSIIANEGQSTPYYHPRSLKVYSIMDFIRQFYVYLVPIALLVAVILQIKRGYFLLKNIKNLRHNNTELLLWLISLGIMLMSIFRIFIISYVTVASFAIGTYVMYLGSVHPLILLYILITFLAKPNPVVSDTQMPAE